MTAPLLCTPLGIAEADLRDARQCATIDAFVRDTPGATPFHLTGWSRAVERGCRQRAHYLLAERADGSLAGVLPLTAMRSPLFGKALVSAGFAVDGGVLAQADGAAASLASGALALAERLGIASVELRGGVVPTGWDVDAATYVGFARDLANDDEAELKAIPRKQRAEVRRASGNDLTIHIGRDATRLAEHHAVYAESVRNLGTPVFPRALMRGVAEELDADVLTIRHHGRAVASVLSVYFGGTVYPYWGGGTQQARGLRANDAVYFALMRHARERGMTRFDFGRSKAGTGAAAFKRNWGFDPQPLAYAKRSSGPAREINPLNPKYALMVRTWQRLPLWLANRLGPPIARGLG